MAGEMHWFRWHHGSVTDPKFRLVAHRSGRSLSDVLAVWAFVLEAASAGAERGRFGQIDAEAVDCLFGFPEGSCCSILAAMEARQLIDAGAIVAWLKRQPKREREGDSSTARVREHRALRKDGAAAVETPDMTAANHGTPRNTKKRLEERRGDKRNTHTPPTPSTYPQAAPPAASGTGFPPAVCVNDDESLKPTARRHPAAEAMRGAGVKVGDTDSQLLELAALGAPTEWFREGAEAAVANGIKPANRRAYALGLVQNRQDAREAAQAMDRAPSRQIAWDSPEATEGIVVAKGLELGLGKWDRLQEHWPRYKARVGAAAAPEIVAKGEELGLGRWDGMESWARYSDRVAAGASSAVATAQSASRGTGGGRVKSPKAFTSRPATYSDAHTRDIDGVPPLQEQSLTGDGTGVRYG